MIWKMTKETVYSARTRICGECGVGGELNKSCHTEWSQEAGAMKKMSAVEL